jgi:RNA polymerase sigma-70 factor (ECF subfamily)
MAFDPALPLTATDAPSDADLLSQVAAGRAARDAIGALYRRHATAVYRYAWLVSGSEAAAADVVQDTFVAVLDQARGFDPQRGTCAAWLCGIARHLALRRFDARAVAVDDLDGLQDAAAARGELDLPPLPEDSVARAQALQRLHAAIRALPPHYRDVLILVELQEMSYADAALAAGIELGTVRSRLSRAKARLLELLQGDDATAGKDPR